MGRGPLSWHELSVNSDHDPNGVRLLLTESPLLSPGWDRSCPSRALVKDLTDAVGQHVTDLWAPVFLHPATGPAFHIPWGEPLPRILAPQRAYGVERAVWIGHTLGVAHSASPTADPPALLTPEMGPLHAPRTEGAARQSLERSRLLASDIESLERPLPTWAGDWGA